MEKIFLNLAGEFLVASELNRRSILCSITYGASKSADVFAFSDRSRRVLRIEVKTTDKWRWPVGSRGVNAAAGPAQVWVLVQLPPALDTMPEGDALRGQHAPRCFVLTATEVNTFARANYDAFSRRYKARHGVPYSKPGVPVVTRDQAIEHEARWAKITALLK